jgi:hypothetical protein
MAELKESTFENNALELFNKLETAMRSLKDIEYSAAVVDNGLAEAKRLLQAGKTAEAEQKYTETRILVERAEASIRAEPLAWRLLWIELAYLLLLLFVGYVTHKWPDYWLWSGFVTLNSATAWFGALGGVGIGLYGLYTHIQARDFAVKAVNRLIADAEAKRLLENKELAETIAACIGEAGEPRLRSLKWLLEEEEQQELERPQDLG